MASLTISANVNNNAPAGTAFNDLYLVNGNIAMAYDVNSILQQCAQAGLTLLGEGIFDTNIGIPYQQTLWIGVPNVSQFIAALRDAFLQVSGVVEVVSIVTSQTNEINNSQLADMLTYTAIIRTIYGTGTING